MHCKLKRLLPIVTCGREVLIKSSLAGILTFQIGIELFPKATSKEMEEYVEFLLGIQHWRQTSISQKLGSSQETKGY